MADIFMAGDALVVDDLQEIITMGDEGFIGCHGGFLKVGVAGNTARVVYIEFAVFPLGFPVDVLRVPNILDPQIVYACTGFGVHIIEGTVMR